MMHLLLPSTVTQKLLIAQASYCRITKLRARLTPKCKKLNIRKCGIVPGFCRSGHIFGVKHFRQYLLGRHFTIYSDHKPLQHLFSENKAIPAMASARIQRWALVLSAYNYDIVFKPDRFTS